MAIAPPPTDDAAALLDRLANRVYPDDLDMADWNRNYIASARHRFLDDLALAEAYIAPASTIVELGAVPPVLTACLQVLGHTVIGIDIDPGRYSAAIADLQLDVRQANFETSPIPVETGTADVVLCNEVFEHLRIDLFATFREVRRVLRPGGMLMLSTPNLLSARGIANLLVRRRAGVGAQPECEYRKLEELGHMGHVREYTAPEVSGFLEAAGFAVRQVVYRGAQRRVSRALLRLVPGLSQHFTVIADRH